MRLLLHVNQNIGNLAWVHLSQIIQKGFLANQQLPVCLDFFFKPIKNIGLCSSRCFSQESLAFILLWFVTPLRPRPILV